LRHRIEWLSAKVLIESGDDDALSCVRQPVTNINKFHIEKLAFIDADNLGSAIEQLEDFTRLRHQLRLDLHLAVADDMILTVAIVHSGLEDLNALASDLRPPQPADELLAFSAEHASANHLDPAQIATLMQQLFTHTIFVGAGFSRRALAKASAYVCSL